MGAFSLKVKYTTRSYDLRSLFGQPIYHSDPFQLIYSVQQQEARVKTFLKIAIKLRDNFAIGGRTEEQTDRQTGGETDKVISTSLLMLIQNIYK